MTKYVHRLLGSWGLMAGVLIAGLLVASLSYAAAPHEQVVLDFNAAFANEDEEGLINTMVDGGVQFTIKSAHAGVDPKGLTENLPEYWSGIIPVIFKMTRSYTRTANIIDSRVEGDIATIWADIETHSVRILIGTEKRQSFKEAYFVIRTDQGWKIAAIMDTRETTKLEDQPAE